MFPSIQKRFVLAALASAVASLGASHAVADMTVTSTPFDNATVQPNGPRSGSSGKAFFNMEGGSNGNNSSYGILDFSAANFGIGNNGVDSVSNLTLDLFNQPSGFSANGTVNFYLTTDTTDNIQPGSSALTYQLANGPEGLGTQLQTLYPLGTGSYVNNANGTDDTYTLTLGAAAQTYLTNQLNTVGNVRLVVTPGSNGTSATYGGFTDSNTTVIPKLTLGLITHPLGANDSVLQIADAQNGGALTKNPQTVTVDRAYKGTTSATIPFTLNNSGNTSTAYAMIPNTANTTSGQSAAVANVGTEPLNGSNSTTTVYVGIAPSNVAPGGGPVTANITLQNQRNTADGNVTISLSASDVVADRFVDSGGSDGNANHTSVGWDFGKILIGRGSANATVTFDTENDTTGNPTILLKDSTVYTKVRLLGNTTLAPTGSAANSSGGKAQVSMSAGGDQDFSSGTESTTRSVTFKPLTGSGGAYTTNSASYDFISFPLTSEDDAAGYTAIGSVIPSSAWGRINLGGTLYQQASLTTTGTTATTLVLNNAKHTVNNVTPLAGGTAVDIGLRVGAQIIGTTQVAQTGFSVVGFANGTDVADNSNTTASVSFAFGGKLNGTYGGNLTVNSQTDDQSIAGAGLNDIGAVVFPLTATVTTNSGDGTANILPTGSFAGYNIHRGSGKDSTIKFLGGTSASGGNISVAWADGVNTTLSDKATVGTTSASDLYVLQMSYDPAAVTNGAASPTLAENVGGHFIGATFGNTGGSALEVNGAYNGNLTLGHYGIDTTNHVVWAVVNSAGDFESIQRVPGDVNGDGHVDVADLSTILNNFGSTTAFWSSGNFDGAATIDLTDLGDALNNFGIPLPAASVVASPATGTTPEPASLGVLSLGMICLIKRRR